MPPEPPWTFFGFRYQLAEWQGWYQPQTPSKSVWLAAAVYEAGMVGAHTHC